MPSHQIWVELADLLAEAPTWLKISSHTPDEIVIRLHHRFVAIDPFVNNNGRHSRLARDFLAERLVDRAHLGQACL